MTELRRVGAAYRARRNADRAAMRKPSSCLPPAGQAKFTQADLAALIAGVPATSGRGPASPLPSLPMWQRRIPADRPFEVRMRIFIATVILAAAIAATPANAAMSVGAFLTRAAPLRANPLLALMSPDYAALKSEADTATRQLRADGAARRAAGKPPIACIPDGQSIGILDMLSGLDALSPAEKKLPLKDGYAKVIARKYPC